MATMGVTAISARINRLDLRMHPKMDLYLIFYGEQVTTNE